MTYFLTLSQILFLHQRLIQQSGGTPDLRDMAALESAVAQPKMTFGEKELYPSLSDKAAALGYSLIKNHPIIRWIGLKRNVLYSLFYFTFNFISLR